MADTNTNPTAQTGGEPGSSANADGEGTSTAQAGGQTAAQQTAGDTGNTAGQQTTERTFTQADVDRIVSARLEEERSRGKRTMDQRVADLEKQLQESRREALVARVAAKHRLPQELADRLRGDTEAELEEDAKSLSKLVPAGSTRGGADGGAGGTGAVKPSMNDFIRRSAGRA